MKVWITKYALTSGIFTAQAEVCKDINEDMIVVKRSKDHYPEHFHGKEWHRDAQSAKEQAESMRNKKIAALNKQIDKIRQLTF